MNGRILTPSGKSVAKQFVMAAFAAASLFCCATGVHAQNSTDALLNLNDKPQTSFGSDQWFAIPSNYEDAQDKYFNLYVTSPMQTTVFVQCGDSAIHALPVQPYSIASFNIPLEWEMKTSTVVEHKAIRVWTQDGDFSAYLMSHNPYSSDGTAIIPLRVWGRENVVASYNGLYGDPDKQDFPSEFLLIANQDSTICIITPTADIRQEFSPHDSPNNLKHPKGIPFGVRLNKGDVVQYKTTLVKNATDYDLTGTYIRSNYAVGLVAGAQCTNVPSNFASPSHLCEMIPPVRLWEKRYYSAPFYPASPGKQWSTYLIIGTQPNQTIWRVDPTAPEHVECVLANKYDHHYSDSIDQCSRWTSDSPFLLVQYVVGSAYPDSVNGQGAPSEVIDSPVEQWSKTVVFQVPVSIGNVSPYKNYVNILVKNSSVKSTKFDNQGIINFTHIPIDSLYDVYRVTGVKAGSHLVTSDSVVGVYIYGYGQNEAYAWGEPINTFSVPPDTATLPVDTVTASVATATLSARADRATLTVSADGRSARAFVPSDWTQPITLEVESLLGINVLSMSGASVPHDFDLSSLPNGAYVYRLSCGTQTVVGKLVIQR